MDRLTDVLDHLCKALVQPLNRMRQNEENRPKNRQCKLAFFWRLSEILAPNEWWLSNRTIHDSSFNCRFKLYYKFYDLWNWKLVYSDPLWKEMKTILSVLTGISMVATLQWKLSEVFFRSYIIHASCCVIIHQYLWLFVFGYNLSRGCCMMQLSENMCLIKNSVVSKVPTQHKIS